MRENLFKSSLYQQIPNGKLYFQQDFLSTREADLYFNTLRTTLPWQQQSIKLFGKSVLQPRLQSWHGDRPYTYSGLTMAPHPWTPELQKLRERTSSLCGSPFNSVLANLYRNGQDSMGWHQDNESELGPNPIIASVNLGESRRFLLKHIHDNSIIELELTHGSLLVMAGEIQHYWKHSVPKTKLNKGERINLTYRMIK
ncbi:alpha-ketoglutarate-dependent dioxygenase AlkB family protein [Vibrio rotiferianus]|uniref:alpha-ketoglutarate-dependent dioxygenase AlkB family protein n=1 Tax=Vibrio rotiferianus TaxID=190895 RepID=UPI0002374F70|nr:alpha-ketoglutarate-dependent dioxygenase AlkB [Vibrio rotiferianus]